MRSALGFAPGWWRRPKFRKLGRRWLFWTILRVFLIAGVGTGVGTARHFAASRLLARATRIVSLEGYSGYYWGKGGTLTLYKNQGNGQIAFEWNMSSQTLRSKEFDSAAASRTGSDCHDAWNGYVKKGFLEVQTWSKETMQRTQQSNEIRESKPDHSGKLRVSGNSDFLTVMPAFSPDGRRVACVCWIEKPDVWSVARHRIQPGYKIRTKTYANIYVGAIDGSDTRYLGAVEVMPELNSSYRKGGGTAFTLSRVDWLSDGKHLAFPYGDGLYAIPVP